MLLGGCADEPGLSPSASSSAAPGRGLYVRSNWQSARGVTGHRVHVVNEKLACAECHDLTKPEIDIPDSEPCARCHQSRAHIEHGGVDGGLSRCTSCHAFTIDADLEPADRARAENPKDCLRCHQQAQNDVSAVHIHASSDCLACHRPHEKPQVVPSSCDQCHAEIETQHAANGKKPSQVCTTCHTNQHAVASAARGSCKRCHAEQKPIIPATALFEDGHTECTGCHRPHRYDKEQAVRCSECHEGTRVLGQGRIAAHNDCTSCHNPHAVQRRISDACVKCHQDTHTDHPRIRTGAVCSSCHDAHPATREAAAARECSSCHHGAENDHAFHGGKSTTCTSCHTPHAFKVEGKSSALCRNCHETQVTLTQNVKAHQSCGDCHQGLPHRPAARLARCADCHGSTTRASVKGHGECADCHEPHGGRIEKPCNGCHSEPHTTAPNGHRNCTTCHSPHSGKQLTGATCESCHAAQVKGPHSDVKGSCGTCHRPHGPNGPAKPPRCLSCHEKKLPGLHTVARHGTCSDCHTAHERPPSAERTACLVCHVAQRKDHHPAAPRCSGCHLFTKP